MPFRHPGSVTANLYYQDSYCKMRSVSYLLRALETFNALGIGFVSLSQQMDKSTHTGKMVFTILGAVAELSGS
jgi:DNA invertase Pin-like site-specific DNA recombinase